MARLCKKDTSNKVILDIKGLLIHMQCRGEDPDAILDEDNKKINTAGFGFNNWVDQYLLEILENHAPRQIIAVWDGGRKYRTSLFSEYKVKRKPYSEVHTKQLDKLYHYAKVFMASLGIIQVQLDGQEADDVIAFLCERIPEFKSVYTVDQDLLQLTKEGSTLVYYQGNATVEFKGHPAKYTTIYKSLVGDTSDNIQGVKGFGDGAFNKVLESIGYDGLEELEQCVKTGNFSVLEEAIEATGDKNLKKIFDGRYADAEQGKTGWQMSYKLSSLAPWLCERRSGGVLPKLNWFVRVPNEEKFKDALKNLAASDRFSEFERYFGQVLLITKDNEHIVRDLIESGEFAKAHAVSFDVESEDELKHEDFNKARKSGGDYVDVLSQQLTGASFCWGDNFQDTIYISVNHRDTNNCDKELILDILKSCNSLVVQNASFEIQVIRQEFDDFILESPTDTAVMATMVDEEMETGLKFCSQHYLNYTQDSYKDTMEIARQELLEEFLNSEPGNRTVVEMYQGIVRNIDELSLTLYDPDVDKKAVQSSIKELRTELKTLRTSPEYLRVAPKLEEIESLKMGMSMLSGEQVLKYGADDSICTAWLYQLYDLILTLEQTRDFTYEHSFDPVHVLNQSFEQGERIDFELLEKLQKEDAEVIADADSFIREKLEAHCLHTNEAHAKEFFIADHEFHLAKWRERGQITDDLIRFKQKQTIEDFVQLTKYQPIEKYRSPVEFIPTPKKLDAVRELVGITLQIEKVSKSALSDWAAQVEQETAEARSFVQLVLAAIDELKGREGVYYEALKTFCEAVLIEGQPWLTRGDELSLSSPTQMTHLLYLKMGLPVRNRTRPQAVSFRKKNRLQGSPSTNEDAIRMAIFSDTSEGDWRREVLQKILDANAAITRGSYYYTPYPLWRHPRDGRIHGGVRFPSTATRRPTASSPNFLQVTKRDGGKVRSAFRPTHEDSVCICIDFAGQELRLTASESKDPVMLDAYLGSTPKDIHSVTAAMICYIYLLQNRPDIIKEHNIASAAMVYEVFMGFLKSEDPNLSEAFQMSRTIAKTVNFLIIYGGSHIALSMKLFIASEVSKMIMSQVMRSYSRLEPWKKEVIEFAKTYGFVKTAYGNRRHIGDAINAKDDGVRGHAERTTVNSVIQACAADILAEVLSTARKERIFSETQADVSTKANGLIPIYDEVKAYCPVVSAWDYVENMQRIMNVTPPGHQVPMLAEVSIGPTWGQLTELGARPTQEQVMQACIVQEPGKLITLPTEKKVKVA